MSRRYPAVDGELEDELIREVEAELEDELETGLGELESEFEDEGGYGELAGELEDELEYEDEDEYEEEYEAEAEFEAVVRELEAEFELEDEGFSNPARRVYSDAEMLAQLAFQAENAESEQEAEAFLAALAPLAFQAAKWALPKIVKHGPQLIRGAVNLGKKLWRNPATRHAVRHVPRILGQTARDVGRRYADGRPINARYVSRRLVGHAVDAASGPHRGHSHGRGGHSQGHRPRPQQPRRRQHTARRARARAGSGRRKACGRAHRR
ncbi:hypothetical protein [Amycolatopsis sp. cg9]|uniref:hypothetical protein n=1 Tax=Amycolatopsis sp. cg9 TaxID=3238801 RepID=UPI003523D937